MKSHVKELWLEDLRSGNYRQTEGTLKRPGSGKTKVSYCCLGVLCNIYQRETGKGKWDSEGNFVTKDGHKEGACLPTEVKNWAGLNSVSPTVPYPGLSHSGGGFDSGKGRAQLMALNDGDALDENGGAVELTFKQIADVIEEHIPG